MPTRGWVLHVAWEVLVQAAHTLHLAGTRRRSADDAAVGRDLLAARLYSRLAHTYWFQKGSLATLYVHLRGLNLTERHPVSAERRSEEHTSELQSLMRISYAVFCLKKNKD